MNEDNIFAIYTCAPPLVNVVRPVPEVVLMRADAFVGCHRAGLIVGEGVRLPVAGWRVCDAKITQHGAVMTDIGQWRQRTRTRGYAFARGAYLHGAPLERHGVREACQAWLLDGWLPLACLSIGVTFSPWGWLVWPLPIPRQVVRNSGPLGWRARQAAFQVVSRFPEGWSQIRSLHRRLLGRRAPLIEYK
jgi:hypothetical protein